MALTLGMLLVVAFGTAAATGTWLEAALVGLPAFAVPFLVIRMAPGSLASRIAVACAFMVFSALTIQQTRGMIEAHFGIFSLLAFLLYYRDWRPIVAAAALIAVHHLVFNYLQGVNAGVYVLQNGPSLPVIILHAVYVVVESAVLVYMAVKLRNEAIQSAVVASVANQIGGGDLSGEFSGEELNRFPLLVTIDQMKKALNKALGSVNNDASALASGAGTLGNASQQVKSLIDDQTDATTAMGKSIEDLTSSIQHLSERAEDARSRVQTSVASAHQGAQIVKSAEAEMNSIAATIQNSSENVEQLGAQSDKVLVIVSLIKDIAGQTNLLALNAAIEAARAGEQGRGFAVVADEVRKLAERTSQATEEIDGMMHVIQTSKTAALDSMEEAVKRVQSGVRLATDAGLSINTINHEAQQVEEVVNEFTQALQQQSTSANEISRNVERVTNMAQSSDQAVNTTWSEVQKLESVSNSLQAAVRGFRLN
jgi:methyl-accepting chemotaxis protein